MAESPPRGDGPDRPDADPPEKKGESDPLFHPANLKTRKTVMGLAPAPHLGGASRVNANEAEARKQRVLARLAAMEGPGPRPLQTNPPPPVSEAPPTDPEDVAKIGTTTTIMSPLPAAPDPHPRAVSSDKNLPAETGWDAATIQDAEFEPEMLKQALRQEPPFRPQQPPPRPSQQPPPAFRPSQAPPRVGVNTEVMEAAPITARMIRTQALASTPPGPMQSNPPGPPPAAALALRPYEPSYSRPPPPALTGPFDPRLVLLGDPHSPRAASFRLLRDTLVGRSMPRVVAVSSPALKDGKTTCSVNLALAFSELASTRVLLIDGNFFEPELGDIFGVDRLTAITPPGGTGWMLPYKLVEVTATLHVAAMAKAAAPRFDQQRFEGMIERLVRISYDYIIIDAPALRGSPAVIQMVSSADGALMAIRSGVSTARDLRKAVDQLPANKALGVALIDAAQS